MTCHQGDNDFKTTSELEALRLEEEDAWRAISGWSTRYRPRRLIPLQDYKEREFFPPMSRTLSGVWPEFLSTDSEDDQLEDKYDDEGEEMLEEGTPQ